MLAALIAFSWWSARIDHIDWHLYSGFAILTLLIFRLLWGFFGSSTARFANFVRGPRAVLAYIRDSQLEGDRPYARSARLSVLAMLGALKRAGRRLGPVRRPTRTAWSKGRWPISSAIDTSDLAREMHECWFNVMLALIALHVARDPLLPAVVQSKKLVGPMITGTGEVDPGAAPMRPGKWWVALLCLVAAIAITRWVIAGAPPFGG